MSRLFLSFRALAYPIVPVSTLLDDASSAQTPPFSA
jgi:hypothetical protein